MPPAMNQSSMSISQSSTGSRRKQPVSQDKQLLLDLVLQSDLTGKDIDSIIGVGQKEYTNISDSMYGQASDLSDNGFGSFDRCLHVIVVCDGNKKEAEKILSKIMLRENK